MTTKAAFWLKMDSIIKVTRCKLDDFAVLRGLTVLHQCHMMEISMRLAIIIVMWRAQVEERMNEPAVT